jgi:putative sterol carrier protein
METLVPQEFFDKVLPERFNGEKAAQINVIVQVNVNGPHGGEWNVTIKDKKFETKPGVHPSPNLTVKMSEKDFLDLINKKVSAEKAFFTGKVHFKGDIALALKLRDAGFL